jgi:ATPase subunit of ABC transporter with duplicated ATPase domains
VPHITVSNLAVAHPGGDLLFENVSFRVSPGKHVGLIGANGVGKTTLLRVLARDIAPEEGEISVGGRGAYMPQDVGAETDQTQTVRELLVVQAPHALKQAGMRMVEAERRLAQGDDHAGMDLGSAIGEWSELGGYELEAQWDTAARRIVRAPFADIADRPAVTLSGGERKRLVLDVLFVSDADLLLLDEPDNFLDVPAKRKLEQQIATSKKTVLLISHDRELLSTAVNTIVTLEGNGAWVHGDSYATYSQARDDRQRRLGDAVKRWRDEERRLFELMRTFKERAKYSSVWTPKANAMETRWRRWVDAGPPPAPVVDHHIRVRLRGGDSARRVVDFRGVGIDGLVRPFSDEIHFGERVGLIGPNGSGKTQLMRVLAGDRQPDSGEVVLGPRVSPGLFTQLNARGDFAHQNVGKILEPRVTNFEKAMNALARYGIADAARRSYDTLSGGQKARLEILVLELEGHNLLLLDEPTDNLDIDSSEALEAALDGFEGTVIAVSHDRAFLKQMDRFLMLLHDGTVLALLDSPTALDALSHPEAAGVRHSAKSGCAAQAKLGGVTAPRPPHRAPRNPSLG